MLLPWLYEAVYQRRKTFDHYREYCDNETLSPAAVRALQWKKFKALLEHAYASVPYYKKCWDSLGISPESIQSMKDVARLPVLTKDIIRERYPDLVAQGFTNNITKATGGSSGVPLKFQLDLASDERRRSIMWRGYRWGGYEMGQRSLYLWGADAGQKSWRSRWKDSLYHRVYNRRLLNSFLMTAENMQDYLAAFNKCRPDVVVAYVTPLLLLADWIKAGKKTVFSPKHVLTGAEPLHDYQRERLQEVFGCPVINTYGCREVMLIAAECQQCGKMHCNDDHLLLETLDVHEQAVSGEPGDLIITDLHNYGFPLIRYRIGDRVTLTVHDDLHACHEMPAHDESRHEAQAAVKSQNAPARKCRLPFSVITEIHGRQLEHIVTLSGSIVPGEFFPHLLKDVGGLIKFQVIQKTQQDIELHFVRTNSFDEPRWEWSLSQIRQQIGEGMQLHCIPQAEIPLTVSGKHLVCVNEWLKTQRAIA